MSTFGLFQLGRAVDGEHPISFVIELDFRFWFRWARGRLALDDDNDKSPRLTLGFGPEVWSVTTRKAFEPPFRRAESESTEVIGGNTHF
jgi:hypothetical protein